MLPNLDRSLDKPIAFEFHAKKNQLLYRKLKKIRDIAHMSIGICAVTFSFWHTIEVLRNVLDAPAGFQDFPDAFVALG